MKPINVFKAQKKPHSRKALLILSRGRTKIRVQFFKMQQIQFNGYGLTELLKKSND